MNADVGLTAVEREVLQALRAGVELASSPASASDADRWTRFGLFSVLEASRVLRQHLDEVRRRVALKADGSPVTEAERDVEQRIRDRLSRLAPSISFVGEETGGSLPEAGEAVAVDPVDGTWAFLAQSATWTCTLAVFRDGRTIAGFVANPMTAEVAHACSDGCARFLRLGAFGEPDVAVDLGAGSDGESATLVHLHPARSNQPVLEALHQAWERGEIRMVRAAGGSPSWGLVEAARGRDVYVNLWRKEAAAAFDLAAGVLLVRAAGGEVTDLQGAPVSPVGHVGPWIAGLDADARARVAAIVGDVGLSER
jgi:fructose-1,6-bisphosphatase/inositol monophosphatase family enzyme